MDGNNTRLAVVLGTGQTGPLLYARVKPQRPPCDHVQDQEFMAVFHLRAVENRSRCRHQAAALPQPREILGPKPGVASWQNAADLSVGVRRRVPQSRCVGLLTGRGTKVVPRDATTAGVHNVVHGHAANQPAQAR